MLEELIFGNFALPGEIVRVLIAFGGTLAATYYDIFNNKNIPNNLLYAFLAISLLVNIIFFNQDLFLLGLGIAAIICVTGYLLYKSGQLGAADIFVLASISLALPLPPSFAKLPFNFPFVAMAFVFSSVLFALYTLFYFGSKILASKKAKPDTKYLLLLAPYSAFVFLFVQSIFFSPVYFAIISIAFLSSVFVMVYRNTLNQHMAEKVPISKLQEEDVLAVELMDKKFVAKNHLQKLLTKKEISRLKKLKLGGILVYTKFPPFLPFIFAGMLLAILFGRNLLLPF